MITQYQRSFLGVLSVKRKLLLIEDEEDLAVAIQFYLQRFGYIVHHSTTGFEGLSLLCNQCWDGVLIDWKLRDISGIDILQKAKDIDPAIIFMMTPREDPREREKVVTSEANIYIFKSFSLDLLRTQLDSVFSAVDTNPSLTLSDS